MSLQEDSFFFLPECRVKLGFRVNFWPSGQELVRARGVKSKLSWNGRETGR